MVTERQAVLAEDSSSGSENGDEAGVDQEGHESGDEKGRKDWGVRAADGGSGGSDRRRGSFCDHSESEEEDEGTEEISDGIARSSNLQNGLYMSDICHRRDSRNGCLDERRRRKTAELHTRGEKRAEPSRGRVK